jgi:FixJ family two-component response regulator
MSEYRHVIAIVDDDPRVRRALRELLESANYRVLVFESGPAFLASADIGRMSCLVTDIGMPEVDGFELREIFHRERPEVPVILITGRHELVEKLPFHEAATILRKPFDGSSLLSAIRQRLGMPPH